MSNVSLFLDMGLQPSSAPLWLPSAATLKEIIVEEGMNSVLLEHKNFEGKPLALMCDKGDESKGRDGAHFPKLVIQYNNVNGKVRLACISIETAGNSSKEAAEGINHALLKFNSNGRIKFVAQGSDAGGGGGRLISIQLPVCCG